MGAISSWVQETGRRIFAVSMVLCLLILTGCPGQGVADYPTRKPTPGNAALPDKPDLNPKRAPAQYDDEAWSIRGVLESGMAGRKGAVAQVRGYVAKIRHCPKGQKVCNPAPHLLLTDLKTLQGRRLLIGGELPLDAVLGQRITVSGTMMTSSPDGLYFAPGGLLLLAPIEPEPSEVGDDAAAATAKTGGKAKD